MSVPSTIPAPTQERDLLTVINTQLAEWKQKGAHVLAPLTLQTVPPMHRPVVVAVQIDPNPVNKEVYPQRGGGLSISSLGWKKIGDAMAIQWLPQECGRVDDGTNPRKVCYRMVGNVKGLDGTWRKIIGDKEIDLDVIEEEAKDSYHEKALAYANDPKDGPDFRRSFPTPDAVQGWITEKVRQDVLQMKKHMLARAQSGAISRATKNIGIRETYTAAELAKPFVFPKLVFSPDPNNPQDRQFLLEQASGATHRLYPNATTSPAPLLALPPMEGPAEVPFLDPGSDEPTWEEVMKEEFKSSDITGQVEILKALALRKAYDVKKLRGNIADWSGSDRAQFLNRLLELPDAPVTTTSTSKLPFD